MQVSKTERLWLCENEWGAFIVKGQKKVDEIKADDPDGEETQIISEVEYDRYHHKECGGYFQGFETGPKRCDQCNWVIENNRDSRVFLLKGEIYWKVEEK